VNDSITSSLPDSEVLASSAPAGRERLAALDVGSNSIRLLVAEYDPVSGLTVVDEVKDQPRLAHNLAETGVLDAGAVERAIAGLARMRVVCQRRGVRRIAAVATSAVREATNGEEFVQRVRDELGIPLRIIDAETEANLSWRSVAHHFRMDGARALVADIGGGSLEIIGAVDGLVESTISLPLGAVRLTESHLSGRKDPRKEVESVRKDIRRMLRKSFPWREWTNPIFIGSGGTFTNLGRMAVGRRGLPVPDSIHGTSVPTGEVEQLLEWLCTRTPEQRKNVVGLNPERADIILAGLAVTAELLDLSDARSVTISAFGLREGLLLEMAGATAPAGNDPLRVLREFVERCQGDRRHVEQVRYLALQLYDQLGEVLGCTPEERALLEAAALLHDVGQLVSYRRHHKHSYQLIMHADRLPLSPRDRAIVALVSRYHRKSGPKKKHEDFGEMETPDQAIVRRLSSLLRVADGLDRGHTAVVDTVQSELTDERLTIRVAPRLANADISLELWGATRKGDVLARLLGREVEVVNTA
jgi:exopolyphosphatase / guanosine-5'-triphosphate,3'-diphosphate pyrophosphatase